MCFKTRRFQKQWLLVHIIIKSMLNLCKSMYKNYQWSTTCNFFRAFRNSLRHRSSKNFRGMKEVQKKLVPILNPYFSDSPMNEFSKNTTMKVILLRLNIDDLTWSKFVSLILLWNRLLRRTERFLRNQMPFFKKCEFCSSVSFCSLQ